MSVTPTKSSNKCDSLTGGSPRDAIASKKDLVLWYCQAQVTVLFPITFDQLPIAKAIQYKCDQINNFEILV